MEFEVLNETKTKLVFKLKGENHTFCNLLKDELYQTKGVEIVTYKIDHPLIGVPEFLIETKGTEPRKVLKEALKNIKKKVEEFMKEAKSL